MDLNEMTQALLTLRAEKAAADTELTRINAEIRQVESDVISKMQESGFDSMKMNGATFSTAEKLTATKTDSEALFDWLEGNGYEGAVKRNVHHMTLNSIVKEVMEQQGVVPDGCELHTFTALSVRKAA